MSAPSSTDPTSRMKIVRVPCERIGMLPRPLTSPTTELSGTIGYRSPIWQTTPGSSCRLSRSPVPGQANVPATESWREAAQMLVHFLSPEIKKPRALSRTWTTNRLGTAGSLLAPTTKDILLGDRRATGRTVADWRVPGRASPHPPKKGGGGVNSPPAGKVTKKAKGAKTGSQTGGF